MGLFEPIWKSKNSGDIEKAKTEIVKMGKKNTGVSRDKKMLDVVSGAFFEEIKSAAVEWISSPSILKELLMKEQCVFVSARRIASSADQSRYRFINEILTDSACPNNVMAPLLYQFLFNELKRHSNEKHSRDVHTLFAETDFPSIEKIIKNADVKKMMFTVKEDTYYVSRQATLIVLNPAAEKTYEVIRSYVGNGLKHHPDSGLPTNEGIALYQHQTEHKAANERGYNLLNIQAGVGIGCIKMNNNTIEYA